MIQPVLNRLKFRTLEIYHKRFGQCLEPANSIKLGVRIREEKVMRPNSLFNTFNNFTLLFILLPVILFTSECTVKIITPYDSGTEQSIAELQKDIDAFLFMLESNSDLPECRYNNHSHFYVDTIASINELIDRNKARPNNEIMIKELQLLSDSVKTLENLHQDSDCVRADQIEILRNGFNSSFREISLIELSRKRNE